MNVADILKQKGYRVIAARTRDTVAEAARLLSREGIGAVLVREGGPDGPVRGVFSERDLVRAVAVHGDKALSMAVQELMTREVVHCTPHDTLENVMALMTARRFRHLPVQEDGRLVGIISIGDVVKLRIAQTEFEAQALRDYVAG